MSEYYGDLEVISFGGETMTSIFSGTARLDKEEHGAGQDLLTAKDDKNAYIDRTTDRCLYDQSAEADECRRECQELSQEEAAITTELAALVNRRESLMRQLTENREKHSELLELAKNERWF